jgi:microcompartment protein CcmL/EutN
MIRGRVAELEAKDWAVQEVQVGESQESLDYVEWGTAITRPDPTLVELLQKQKNYIEELRQAVQYAVDQIDQIASRERIEKVYKRMKEVLRSKARCAGAIPQLLTKPAHKAFVEGSND